MKTGATAREFLNRHLGHSATVEWNRSGFKFFSQQLLGLPDHIAYVAEIHCGEPKTPTSAANDAISCAL